MLESNLQSIKSTEVLVNRAYELGLPKDQLERFLKYKYVPLDWQLKFHAIARESDNQNGPVDIGCGGARGPGKSHGIFAQLTLDDCQRVPGLKGLFLRQTGKSANESFQDLIDEVLKGKINYKYNTSKGVLYFPNGSRVILGGFETEDDIDKYVGIQYDTIAIEERNQLTGEKILKLKGSLRTTKPNWRARMYSSFNPGNRGHNDVKQTFVIPYQTKTQTKTRFIPSTYKDNPFLKPEYIDYLDSLPGALGKAWREGNFDTFEGQYFIEWDYNRHTIAPFPIPPTWKRFRAYDHGRENPATCGWYALDYNGRVWVYKELYVTGKNVDEIALGIHERSHDSNCLFLKEFRRLFISEETEKQLIVDSIKNGLIHCSRLTDCEVYEDSLADPSIFHNIGLTDKYGGQTIGESFARLGIMFRPASNRRVDGWNIMHQYLAWTEQTIPKLIYFTTCYDSIRTLPSLVHDKNKPEDVDSNGEDHTSDRDRYILVQLHDGKTAKPLNEVQKTLKEMQGITGQTDLNALYYP